MPWYGKKQNLTQQKHAFTNEKNVLQHKINTKKLKPGLVTSYDIRPGNGEGLFGFQHFINLSLTYLDIYPLTHGPRTHTGHGRMRWVWQVLKKTLTGSNVIHRRK